MSNSNICKIHACIIHTQVLWYIWTKSQNINRIFRIFDFGFRMNSFDIFKINQESEHHWKHLYR